MAVPVPVMDAAACVEVTNSVIVAPCAFVERLVTIVVTGAADEVVC